MPDSSEELHQRVDELEATIRGLTQELVEANERIRQLEEEVEATPETIVADDGSETEESETSKPMGTEMETDPEAATETDSGTEEEAGSEEEADDIIVA